MSLWFVVGLALTTFWAGMVFGILVAALGSANRRGGDVDLTGCKPEASA